MTYPNRPYCTHCGAQMTATPIHTHYDKKTGERLYRVRFRCPNWRWWKMPHDQGYLGDSKPILITERKLWYDAVVPEELT